MSPPSVIIRQLRESGICIESLVNDIKHYMPGFNEHKFREAYTFASSAHDGQIRKDGKTPYIAHPLETAVILAGLHVDEDTLIASLLHDVPEDTNRTIAEIRAKFGDSIAFLVDGVTKLSKVHYVNNMENRQVESLKKMFIHSAEDPRIILIKLADRLHNMRTLQNIEKEEKRIRIARETMEIFVPIANLLGIEELKTEMEDLCFKFLLPDEFAGLQDKMKRVAYKNDSTKDEIIRQLNHEIQKDNIDATIFSRNKNLYSIFKKIAADTIKIHELDDQIWLCILVNNKEDCYRVLGIVHSLFKPKPGKFKDYIAVPKINGYRSLHTTVFGVNGINTEILIRTHEMHMEAEYGIASLYINQNSHGRKNLLESDKRNIWIDKVMQIHRQREQPEEFIEDLKSDVLRDRIFVFTPVGESIDLPQDATCIDFAYHIHTEIGHRALKAEVNGQIVPMATMLHSGDTVRIITSDLPRGPKRSWLPFAKTNAAKNRIRDYLKKTTREEKLLIGKTMLQKELDLAGLGLIKTLPGKRVRAYLQKNPHFRDMNDVSVAIGDGTLHPLDVISSIYPKDDAPTLGILGALDKLINRCLQNHDEYTKVQIKITSKDAIGQLEKILKVASLIRINALTTYAHISFWNKMFICKQLLSIKHYSQISELFEYIEQIDGVKRIERVFWQRRVIFICGLLFTFAMWVIHPFLLRLIITSEQLNGSYYSMPLLYGGLFMLFVVVALLKGIAKRSFPELRETNTYWFMTLLLTIFASATIIAEVIIFNLNYSLLIIGLIITLIFAYLLREYLLFKKKALPNTMTKS